MARSSVVDANGNKNFGGTFTRVIEAKFQRWNVMGENNCKMAVEGEDFSAALERMQSEEDLHCDLGSKVSAIVVCAGGFAIGLCNGKVTFATIGKKVETVDMTSESGGHSNLVTSLAVTTDGSRVVSGSLDNTVRVWNLATKNEEVKFEEHLSIVWCVAVTPDGSRVVSGSGDETVRVWNLAGKNEETKFEGHFDRVCCLAVTPDSLRVVSGSSDNTVRVWNLAEKNEEVRFEGHSGAVWCLAVTPDGSRVVSGSDDKTVRVWNLAEKSEEMKFEGHSSFVNSLAVTPDGSRIVSGSYDHTIRVWNFADKNEEVKFEGHSREVKCLAITPDGSRIVSGSDDNTVRVWNLAEQKEEVKFEEHSGEIRGLAVTPDGSQIVSGSWDATIRVWNLAEKNEEIKFEGHSFVVNCMKVTFDGARVVSGSLDNTIRVWNLSEKKEEVKFEGHSGGVWCLEVTPDGSRVVSGSLDSTVRVWNLADQKEEIKFEGHSKGVNCLAVTPDGSRVVSGSSDSTVRVWNLIERKEETKFEGHSDSVCCLAVTPDGSRVVSGSPDKTVRVWSLATKNEEIRFEGHEEGVICLVVTPNGLRALSGSKDCTIRVWNFAAKNEEIRFEGHSGAVWCLAVTPDGSRVVSGSFDHTIRVWNLTDKSEEIKFEGHSNWVHCLAVTPDGSRVVSGSWDATVRVWNLSEKKEEAKFEGHSKEVKCLAVTPDGSRVVSASEYGTILVHQHSYSFTCPPPRSCPSDLRLAIASFRSGRFATFNLAKCVFPQNFNSLHIFAYFNHSKCLYECLKNDVPIIHSAFGSSLTLALARNSTKCVDAILQYFIDCFEEQPVHCLTWVKFAAINDDLPKLLKSSACLLQRFFASLMPATEEMPEFINPSLLLPHTAHLPSHFVDISRFSRRGSQGTQLVKFYVSGPRWDFSKGNKQSLVLLTSLLACENRSVLCTLFVSTLIEEKWTRFFPLTLSLTLAYAMMLTAICCILFSEDSAFGFAIVFSILNAFFVLYEVVQLCATRSAYLSDLLNYIDMLRGVLSVIWGALVLFEVQQKDFTLTVVVLCFLRGFTFFRSFKMTRIFVYMTLTVIREMYSFLIILWYSVFAFSIFNAILLEVSSLADAWTAAYNLLMGNFDNSYFGVVEWIVFTCASVTNVIIMLNLLVSILGEAYEKTQMSVRENDLRQQLEVVVEYEFMFFWRRSLINPPTVLMSLRLAEEESEGEEWQGQILQITKSIKTSLEQQVGTKLDAMGEELRILKEELIDLKDQVSKKLSVMEEHVDQKLDKIEQQLQAILVHVGSKNVV